jgi:hypothetical protein
MQLEYTKAHQHLLTATRKAPQQTAIGFRQNVNKLEFCDYLKLFFFCIRLINSLLRLNYFLEIYRIKQHLKILNLNVH